MFPDAQISIPLYAEPIVHGLKSRGIGVVERVRRREFSGMSMGIGMAMASAWLSPTLSKASNSPQRVSIALAAKNSLYHLPLVLADQLGMFKNENLYIDWLESDSGSQAVQLALSGQAEVISGAFEHALDLQARGLNYRAFVLQGRAPQMSVGLATRKANAMKSLADLKTLRLGISALGSGTHGLALHWMLKANLSSELVQFVELGASTANVVEAIKTGAVDALCFVDPVMHYLEQKNELRLLADTRSLLSSQRMYGGPMLSACLMGKAEFLQKRADVGLALTMGVVRALQWLKTAGPSDILKTVPSNNWMGDRAIYLGALEKVRDSYSLDGVFSAEALQTAWRARATRVSTDRANLSTLGQSYTNEFALLAKRKFNA
jgi:NitT/TauT family transport system substrate-binding protein